MAFDVTAYIARVEKFPPSRGRDAVLSNLKGNAYTRAVDIETDIADLERTEVLRAAAEKVS